MRLLLVDGHGTEPLVPHREIILNRRSATRQRTLSGAEAVNLLHAARALHTGGEDRLRPRSGMCLEELGFDSCGRPAERDRLQWKALDAGRRTRNGLGTDSDSSTGNLERLRTCLQALGADDNPPDGLILHAAGEENGKWRSVDVWESESAYNRFRDARLMPAVREAMGEEAVAASPPPQESFEIKHLVKP